MKRLVSAAFFLAISASSAFGQSATSSSPGCDPTVRDAIVQTAQQGAQNSVSRVRNSFEQPRSVFDMSCLESLFSSARSGNILYDDSSIFDRLLQMGQQAVCSAARQAWYSTNTRSFDANQFFNGMPGIIPTTTTVGSASPVILQEIPQVLVTTPTTTTTSTTGTLGTLFSR